ncbi:MAG: DUF434 domain-containing protein [Candidatus Aenigmarchaeota archaeon]|nr:DUF434 domain-containing protein [Candidatus Aenigmarchaeota archaeon]
MENLYTDEVREAAEVLRYLLNHKFQRKNIKNILRFIQGPYNLNADQIHLLDRAVYSDKESEARSKKLINVKEIRSSTLGIDGYNVLVTLESALEGKPLVQADDGLIRDIAGKSSRYRPSETTYKALNLIFSTLKAYPPRETLFLFDERIGMSVEFAKSVRGMLNEYGLCGDASVANYPDEEILEYEIIATSDSTPIDKAKKVFDLAGYLIKEELKCKLIRLR